MKRSNVGRFGALQWPCAINAVAYMAIDMTDFPVFLNMLANDDNFTTSHIINTFVKRKSVATHKTEQDCKHYVYNDVTCPILMGAIFEIDPKKNGSSPARDGAKNVAHFLGALFRSRLTTLPVSRIPMMS